MVQLGNKINRHDPATAIPLLEKKIENLTKGQNKLEIEIENLPAVDKNLYRVDIFADNGSNLSTEVPTTTLSAQLTMWDIDITADTDASFFSWTRVSGNDEEDALWNGLYGLSKKSITLQGGDVGAQSTFICTVNDRSNLYTQSQIIVSSTFALEEVQAQANKTDEELGKTNETVKDHETRIVSAETAIEKTNEAIKLLATKKEVEESVDGLVSETAMEAAIKASADAITASVEENYTSKDAFGNVEERLTAAEQKITADAIIQTVSGTYITKNDASGTYETKQNVSALSQRVDGFSASIEEAGKKATSFLDYVSGKVTLGYKENGVWVSGRAQIEPNKYSLLDSSGNVLSSFGTEEIWLGNESTVAKVHLCGGMGLISVEEESSGNEFLRMESENFRLHADKIISIRADHDISTANIYATAWGTSEGYSIMRMTSETETGRAQIELGSYDTTEPWVSIGITESPASLNHQVGISFTPEGISMTSKAAGLTDRKYGVNKVLWSGAEWMTSSTTITLSEAISAQPNGIVLVFSSYNVTDGAPYNYNWNHIFVPKHTVSAHSGQGHDFILLSGSNLKMKYFFIRDTQLIGYKNSEGTEVNSKSDYTLHGKEVDQRTIVLRYVIGV